MHLPALTPTTGSGRRFLSLSTLVSPPRKTADEWFAEYGESHQDPTNELIHWICVPTLFFAVVGFIWIVPVPATLSAALPGFRWSIVGVVLAMIFYVRLSPPLAVGMLAFILACHLGLRVLVRFAPWPVWEVCLALFVIAWTGQMIGHLIEGRKPSFIKDVAFLLIGPAWLLHFVYQRFGLRY